MERGRASERGERGHGARAKPFVYNSSGGWSCRSAPFPSCSLCALLSLSYPKILAALHSPVSPRYSFSPPSRPSSVLTKPFPRFPFVFLPRFLFIPLFRAVTRVPAVAFFVFSLTRVPAPSLPPLQLVSGSLILSVPLPLVP